MTSDVKTYWNDRAAQHTGSPSATTADIYLRQLEATTLITAIQQLPLPRPAHVLDVGCGDAHTLLQLASSLPDHRFVGLDFSENMLTNAHAHLATMPELRSRVQLHLGDVLDLDDLFAGRTFPIITSDRCLINLDSPTQQARAVAQIAAHTSPGGFYLAIENFHEGQDALNAMRRSMGLPEIPIRWHNLYLHEPAFAEMIEPYFDSVEYRDFASSYYFATRVVYAAQCAARGVEPEYHHDIHRLSPRIPPVGRLSPIRLVIMHRRTSKGAPA